MTALKLEDFELRLDNDGDYTVYHLGKLWDKGAAGNRKVDGIRWYYNTQWGARRAIRRACKKTQKRDQRIKQVGAIKIEPAWHDRLKSRNG